MRTMLQIVLCTGLVCHVSFVSAHGVMALRRKLGLGRPPEIEGDESLPPAPVATFGAAAAAVSIHNALRQ